MVQTMQGVEVVESRPIQVAAPQDAVAEKVEAIIRRGERILRKLHELDCNERENAA